jgi:hypothetical protein
VILAQTFTRRDLAGYDAGSQFLTDAMGKGFLCHGL